MSEENSLIYCSECGSSNPATFKFCSNCGARLIQEQSPSFEESVQEEKQAYEKVDAEIVSEGKVPITQEELNINYDSSDEGSYSSGVFTTPAPEYHSSGNTAANENGTNGNIGFSIASMVCGIISLVCCCLGLFSLILAIAAIVLGVVSLNGKYDGRGMAIAGIVTGGIGIAIWLLLVIINGSAAFLTAFDEIW